VLAEGHFASDQQFEVFGFQELLHRLVEIRITGTGDEAQDADKGFGAIAQQADALFIDMRSRQQLLDIRPPHFAILAGEVGCLQGEDACRLGQVFLGSIGNPPFS
jgi:hypothetical protein